MAEGKAEHDWTLICEVMANDMRIHGGKRARKIRGRDLNPYAKRRQGPKNIVAEFSLIPQARRFKIVNGEKVYV